MAQHAKLSPSSTEKWTVCAGSIAMEEGFPETPSEYTDEGTAAHFVASTALTEKVHPATYIGRKVDVGESVPNDFDGAVWDTSPTLADWKVRHTFEVDMDMVAHVNTYVQNILRSAVGGEMLVEQKLMIDWITGEEDASGTGDVIILKPAIRRLEVHDLKYGQGQIVSAEENKQLMTYGLAALEQYGIIADFDEVLLVIHQPRVYHKPTEWLVPAARLREFEQELREAAKLAMHAYEYRDNWLPKKLSESVEYLTPSEDGCRWCKAKATCPALAQQAIAAVADDFVDLDEPLVPQLEGCDKRTMDPTVLANASEAVELVEMWCKAVRAKVFADLMANIPVPRHKLVQGKKGHRNWRDEIEAAEVLKSMKLDIAERYVMKVISPTVAEKIYGEKGSAPSVKRWNKLQLMITQKEGALSVAPENDPRPAVVIDKSADFVDNSGDDLA